VRKIGGGGRRIDLFGERPASSALREGGNFRLRLVMGGGTTSRGKGRESVRTDLSRQKRLDLVTRGKKKSTEERFSSTTKG